MRRWIGKLKCWLGRHDWEAVYLYWWRRPTVFWLDGASPIQPRPKLRLCRELIGYSCHRCDVSVGRRL